MTPFIVHKWGKYIPYCRDPPICIVLSQIPRMKIITLFVLVLAPLAVEAQGVFSNKTNTALQKVIEDYPNKFRNIIGDKISVNQQETDYRSKIEVSGAMASIITQHNDLYSWKSELFESSNFDHSRERFKEVFDNIKNTIVKIEGMSSVILNGKYEYPTEDKKNTTIAFQLLPANGGLQKLKVELSLRQASNGWKVVLCVHEKDVDGLAVN